MTIRRLLWWMILLAGLNCPAERIPIEYFFQPGCGECEKVNTFVLPRLAEGVAGRYELRRYDTGVPENFLKLVAAQERLGIDSSDPVAIIVNHQTYLGGFREIEEKLFHALETAEPAAVPTQSSRDPELVHRRAEALTAGTIAVAGLIDGINPCVFATLIFFLSLLAVSRIGGFRLLLAGSSYCFGCFLTYFAMGFGLFRFLKLFSGYRYLQHGFELVLILLLLILAFFSFRDAIWFRKSGRADAVSLQLPNRIKRRIHEIMRRGLGYRWLLPGAFTTGMLVTVLESACTGQIYVPALALMVKESGPGSRWIWYLLLYNIMFLLPLLFLFAAAYRGTTTRIFLRWSKTNVVYGKIAIGSFFLLLAALYLATTIPGL